VVVLPILQQHTGGECFYDISFKILVEKTRDRWSWCTNLHTRYTQLHSHDVIEHYNLQYSNKGYYGPIECSSSGSMLYDNYYPDAHTFSFVSDLQLANLVHIDPSPTPLNPFIAASDFDLSVPPSTHTHTHTHTPCERQWP